MNETAPKIVSPERHGRAMVQFLNATPAANVMDLLSRWRARDPLQWAGDVEVYRLLGERILKLGEPLLAFDVVAEGLLSWKEDVRLRQLLGLALSRSGALERANNVFSKLRLEGHVDEETLGMLARTHKDLAARAHESAEQEMHLRLATEIYTESYKRSQGYWSGINAASLGLTLGEEGHAKELAVKIRKQCLDELKSEPADSYWLFATLGEVCLIMQEWAQAEEWYVKASASARGRFGDVHSSRRNARLILGYWDEDPARIDRWLKIPNVAVFTGHMVDHPSRLSPRFPKELERAIAEQIQQRVKRLEVGFGYSSAACGSDILFLEAVLEAGGEICVVLPYDKEEFVKDSVSFAGDEWSARMERVLSRAAHVETASTQKMEIGAVSYDYANQLVFGLASIRARQLETKLTPMAVWDGARGDGPGGTASVIERWRGWEYKVEIVPLKVPPARRPAKAIASNIAKANSNSSFETERRIQFGSRIVAMLFADAVGFSTLTEVQVRSFVEHCLGAVAELIDSSPYKPLSRNTWGDGLYLVFENVGAAGMFALEFCDLVRKRDWTRFGLPKSLTARIALHAGPVYEYNDPITRQQTYSGTHVSRAARIEPIAPPGQVYASEAFAALAAIQRSANFACHYVGQTPLAKGYGTFRTYHVRRI
ncbi:MAG TPA: adenylate/guanylate cyclase domain-containing protein [Verrucomicrobiae bacterium]